MKHATIWAVPALVLTTGLLLVACGDGDATPTSGSGGAGAGGSTSSGPLVTVSVSTSGTGGAPPDGNRLESARPTSPGGRTEGSVSEDDPVDWWVFDLDDAGVLRAYIWDAGSVDLTLTLFDEDGAQLGHNSDSFGGASPRPSLTTRVLTPGTYYLRVQEQCAWSAEQGDPCHDGNDVSYGSYDLHIYDGLNNALYFDHDEHEPAVAPVLLTAVTNGYTIHGLIGSFDAADVDTYSIDVPSNYLAPTQDGGRPALLFALYGGGPEGNGSTARPVRVRLTDTADPAAPTAMVFASVELAAEPADRLFTLPMPGPSSVPGGDFSDTDTVYLHVEAGADPLGDNPFHYIEVFGWTTNPWEVEPNDDPLVDATPLSVWSSSGPARVSYLAGDLEAGDVDTFWVDLATAGKTGATNVSVACSGARYGAGLTDLTAELLAEDASVLASGVETMVDALAVEASLPGGASGYYIRMTAGTPPTDVDGRSYHCNTRLE